MHMTKNVKCHFTVSFKPSSNMSLKTAIWCFRVRVKLNLGSNYSIWLVFWPELDPECMLLELLKCLNKFHFPHLITVVLKSWNIQAGSASWTDRLGQKNSELIWRFLADGASPLTHEVFSPKEGWFFSPPSTHTRFHNHCS